MTREVNKLIQVYGSIRAESRRWEAEGEETIAADLLAVAKELERIGGRLAGLQNRHAPKLG